MQRAEKQAEIEGLKDRFERMISAVFVDYKGLNVADVTLLRDKLREAGVEYRVVKNTLIRRSLEGREYAAELDDTLKGMTAVAWSYEEPGTAAKVFKEFGKKNQKLQVKAGVIEQQVLDAKAVLDQLATMPGRDELRAKLLATFQAPAQKMLQLLSTPAQNFVYLLEARRAEQEGKE
ncbi:MAG: 50S ribosomal protein L10 [Deltaproteobacteria bacterium]|jgi:large subunit ribosomal protein L10|nr:50S ribosomal protein L10 [Deltaproteobacteria bacterium]MBW2531656.1 50S ribosomal protein L10 [Deltaproteobacteria bacterium]